MLFLFSCVMIFFSSPDSFKSFTKSGHDDVCLVDYKKKTIECNYKSFKECSNNYVNGAARMCFRRKDLKLKRRLK